MSQPIKVKVIYDETPEPEIRQVVVVNDETPEPDDLRQVSVVVVEAV